MNWLDIAIVVFAGIVGLIGLKLGLIRMALGLAGLVLGVYLAGRFYVDLGSKLGFIETEGLARIAAFVIIFLATLLFMAIVAAILQKVLSMVLLGWVDKLGGFVGGAVLGGVICGALLAIIIKYTNLGVDSFVAQSQVAAFVVERFPLVLALLPKEFDAVRQFFS